MQLSRSRYPNWKKDWDFLVDQREERSLFLAGGVDVTDIDFEKKKRIKARKRKPEEVKNKFE